MGYCKDCKFWGVVYSGVCDKEKRIQSDPESTFEIEAFALDDSGLEANLVTGPMFGCVHFVKKS